MGSESPTEVLGRAVESWKKAQLLDLSPTWKGEPEATYYAERVAKETILEVRLLELLQNNNQLVVAHSLHALELMQSSVLLELSKELLARRDKLTLHMGSFRWNSDLGGYAREIQKRCKSKA
jgi:hypothetical protein